MTEQTTTSPGHPLEPCSGAELERAAAILRESGRVSENAPLSCGFLVEPLKEIVFNRPSSVGHLFAGLLDRVKLFCTVYDPATGRYRFDNSLFVQIAVGASMILAIVLYLFNEILKSRRAREQE